MILSPGAEVSVGTPITVSELILDTNANRMATTNIHQAQPKRELNFAVWKAAQPNKMRVAVK